MSSSLSTSGYGETAQALIGQYESISFEDVHGLVLHLFPRRPARVLDIGAGTGRDAAGLARRGHTVTAVEPTDALREWGQAHHSGAIRWIDDMLPQLQRVRALAEQFDLILLTAVWMHLDADQQSEGMDRVAGLLVPGGRVSMTLRHGPVPEGRRMFEVSAQQTAALAARHGLQTLHRTEGPDMLGRPEVTWTLLVLEKPREGS